MKGKSVVNVVVLVILLWVLYALYNKAKTITTTATTGILPGPLSPAYITGVAPGFGYAPTAGTYNPMQNVLGQITDAFSSNPANTGKATSLSPGFSATDSGGMTEGDLIQFNGSESSPWVGPYDMPGTFGTVTAV